MARSPQRFFYFAAGVDPSPDRQFLEALKPWSSLILLLALSVAPELGSSARPEGLWDAARSSYAGLQLVNNWTEHAMTENTRDAKGRLLPGANLNPAGRPKGAVRVSEASKLHTLIA